MNWNAYHERKHNERYITPHYRQGCKVIEVERRKVRFKGRPWLDLSTFDKRKFENTLFLEHMDEKRLLVKVVYL